MLMADGSTTVGQLFSRIYIEKGEPRADSARFRSRLAAKIESFSYSESGTARLILEETGAVVPRGGVINRPTYYFGAFIKNAELRDLLDVITLIHRSLQSNSLSVVQKRYREDIERTMREENVSYRLDSFGGVHFYVDEEFERSRFAAISGMSSEKHRAAREAFDDAHRALLSTDLLSAVRRSFDAVENVFKLQYNVPRLGVSEIKTKLTPVIAAHYTGRVADAGNRLLASFGEWTNAAHQFRHAPGEADPSPPPTEIAILMVSQAATHLRWLLSLEA
jgi:hypothetical protein